MTQPMTPTELAAFRARQKSRSRALALVLGALVVLFFVISLVKIKNAADLRHQMAMTPPTAEPTELH